MCAVKVYLATSFAAMAVAVAAAASVFAIKI